MTKRVTSFLASVPSRVGPRGNSIVAIDPLKGKVLRVAYVGSEPNKLVLSDDGTSLWVGLDGAAAIRKFDVGTFAAGAQHSLGEDPFFGSFYAAWKGFRPSPITQTVDLRDPSTEPSMSLA